MEWLRRIMMPPQGSAFAGEVDIVYMAMFWLSVVLFLGIAFRPVWFAWRYRYQARPRDAARHPQHHAGSRSGRVLPLLLCVGIFFWGLNGWMKYAVAPGEAMEVQVTAKQVAVAVRVSGRLARRVNESARSGEQAGEVHHDQRGRDARFLRARHARQARHHSRPLHRSLVHAHRARQAQLHLRRILRQGPLRHAGDVDRRKRRRFRTSIWRPAARSGKTTRTTWPTGARSSRSARAATPATRSMEPRARAPVGRASGARWTR